MKKIMLIVVLTAIMLACTPKNDDGTYESDEWMNNLTPYELKLVFSGGTTIIIDGAPFQNSYGYGQRKTREYKNHKVVNDQFIEGESLDSIIFDNKWYIDLSENAPHREYIKRLERLNDGFWRRSFIRNCLRYNSTVSMSEYYLAIPIPAKE